MKKILTAGLLALAVAATAGPEASAWINSKFGVGFNWNYQSGGNNVIWGLFRNGQPPGPGGDPCGSGGFGPGSPGSPGPACLPGYLPGGPGGPGCMPLGHMGTGHFPGFIPPGYLYGPQEFQYFGKQPQNQNPIQQPNNAEVTQQGNNPYRTSSYSGYPYNRYYYPANGNAYYNPTTYSFGVNVGR